MSKLAFFFVTLIAAIPAGILGYLAVMGFLKHSEAMPGILMGVTGIMLLMCAAVVVMPIAVLLRRGPRPAEDEGEAGADAEAESVEESPSEAEFDEHDDAVVGEEFNEAEDSEIYAEDEDEDLDFDAFEDEDQKR